MGCSGWAWCAWAGNHRGRHRGVTHRGQLHRPHLGREGTGQFGRDLEREAGSCPPHPPGQRHQPVQPHHIDQFGHLALAAHEAGDLLGQVPRQAVQQGQSREATPATWNTCIGSPGPAGGAHPDRSGSAERRRLAPPSPMSTTPGRRDRWPSAGPPDSPPSRSNPRRSVSAGVFCSASCLRGPRGRPVAHNARGEVALTLPRYAG